MIDINRETPLSLKEAASRVGVTARTVWNWIQSGRLEACRCGRNVRTSVEALARFTSPYRPARESAGAANNSENDRAMAELREEHGLKV